MYDIIGDIHGHADRLEALLRRMDYLPDGDGFKHPERKVIFVGDFVDRGPRIKRTLDIARSMVADGNALAVMGNHELNTLCLYTENSSHTGYLRSHSKKNLHQHSQTRTQLSDAELEDALNWFYSLPLWLELEQIRVVHACWDPIRLAQLEVVLDNARITPEVLRRAYDAPELSDLYVAIEETTKGKEVELPEGSFYLDKAGIARKEARISWFRPSLQETYRTYSFPADPELPELELPLNEAISGYCVTEKPVFFGHYWLTGTPQLLAPNVACVDYSVANNGILCSYRWDGGSALSDAGFCWL